MTTPRRSTRSQSRELGLLDSDGEASNLASTSGRRSNGQTSEKKPRGSTRRKIKKSETIEEDDDLVLVEEIAAISEISPSKTSPKAIAKKFHIASQEIEEEVEVDEVVDSLDTEFSTLPAAAKSRKLRQKVILFAGKLTSIFPYLPPILLLASFLLAILLPSPNEPFARKVYVDENALQPGSATVEWGWSQVDYADRAADKIAAVVDAPADVRAALLSRELQSIGLTAYNQSFTFEMPSQSGIKRIKGINTYARFPAARGDGREAFVLAASWKSAWDGTKDPDLKDKPTNRKDLEGAMSDYERKGVRRTNVRGLATTLLLARHLSGYGHWSKDLIFVFSDGELEGMQAWTSSYFGKEQSNLKSDRLTCSGSAIWNALAIDYPSDSFSHIVIKHEGLQGQLPNMDIINTFTRIAQKTDGLPVSLSASSEHDSDWIEEPLGAVGTFLEKQLWKDVNGAKKYLSGLLNVASQIGFLSVGQPSGIHGVFHQYHVDAITLFLNPASGPYGFHHIGRAVESMTRSMSNLLERLHHSQFFYLLTSPYRFIEVAKYLPVAAFLSVALTIVGIGIWIDEGRRSHQRKVTLLEALRAAIDEEMDESNLIHGKEVIHFNDVPLDSPTVAQLLSRFISLLVDRSLQRGELIGTNKLRSAATLMQVLGRPTLSASAVVLSCHFIGGYAYYIITRAPVNCAENGLDRCKSLRLVSAITMLSTMLVIWRTQASNKNLLSRRLIHCQNQLPDTLIPFLLTFQAFRTKAIARTVYSFALLETGMLIFGISLVNFSLAFVFGFILCIPFCTFKLPSSTSTREIQESTMTELERSASPASNDTDNVELITRSLASNQSLSWQTKLRLWLQAGAFVLLTPFSLVYLAKAACIAACHYHWMDLSASTWLDWTFDDVLFQHHLLGTLALPFITLVYLPIVLVALVANALAALD